MIEKARQLCAASSKIAATPGKFDRCPTCGREVNVTEFVRIRSGGKVERHGVVPGHPRDEMGERRVALAATKSRYPGSGGT